MTDPGGRVLSRSRGEGHWTATRCLMAPKPPKPPCTPHKRHEPPSSLNTLNSRSPGFTEAELLMALQVLLKYLGDDPELDAAYSRYVPRPASMGTGVSTGETEEKHMTAIAEVTKDRKIKNRKIAVLMADGFEMAEYTIPVNALRMAGAKVTVVSLRRGRIRGVNLHEPAHRVRADLTVDEAAEADFDGLFVPGGFINPDLLRQSERARKFLSDFETARKPIATLCHGPWVLASSGLLRGRTVTSWPGIRDDVVNAGGIWLDQPVVRDGNWLTSRGPQDFAQFVPAVLEFFHASREELGSHVLREKRSQSSPQRTRLRPS